MWRMQQWQAVPCLRQLFAGLSPRRPWFAPWSIHVGFMVDKVVLWRVYLVVLLFSLSVSFHRGSSYSYSTGWLQFRDIFSPLRRVQHRTLWWMWERLSLCFLVAVACGFEFVERKSVVCDRLMLLLAIHLPQNLCPLPQQTSHPSQLVRRVDTWGCCIVDSGRGSHDLCTCFRISNAWSVRVSESLMRDLYYCCKSSHMLLWEYTVLPTWMWQ
jgi:hypothetical protein